MGYQTLGNNSRYQSVIQVNGNTQDSFQQEDDNTYDVSLTTSSSIDQNLVWEHSRNDVTLNSNTSLVYIGDGASFPPYSYEFYVLRESGVAPNGSVEIQYNGNSYYLDGDGTSKTVSGSTSGGASFSVVNNDDYDKVTVDATLTITLDLTSTSSYTVSGVDKK